MLTHLDLFTGIGGFHLAAEWAGRETIGFSEIEPYCCELLTQHWPHIPNYGDITKLSNFEPLRGRVDIISAGVPCQPASLAGKRLGEKDDRWLWPATLDVVELVRPSWCIFENPAGILSLPEFDGILLRLETLGYQSQAFRVPANAVGAKHLRYRVFIVANSESRGLRRRLPQRESRQLARSIEEAKILADADSNDRYGRTGAMQVGRIRSEGEIKNNGYSGRIERPTESPLCRAVNGLPNRSHRLRALGNSVVPQQAAPFFQAIVEAERLAESID